MNFDFDFVRRRYDFELERKDKLTAAVGLPVAIVSALAGFGVTMARSFAFDVNPWLSLGFDVGLMMAGGQLLVALHNLSRVYRGATYVYLPKLADLQAALEAWREFHSFGGEPPASAEDDFDNQLGHNMISAADSNTASNDVRTGHLDRANTAVMWMVYYLTAAALLFVLAQLIKNGRQ